MILASFLSKKHHYHKKDLVPVPIDSSKWFCQNRILVASMEIVSGRNENHHDERSDCMPGLILREVVVGAVGYIEQPEESYGHGPGPVPQTVRHYANATSSTITQWIPCWALGHMGLTDPEQHLPPQLHQPRGPGRQGLATHGLEPSQGLSPEHLPQLPKNWNLSLTSVPDPPPQDRVQQSVYSLMQENGASQRIPLRARERQYASFMSTSIPLRIRQCPSW